VDKVVRRLDALQRPGQRGRIQDIAGDDPRAAADTRREVRRVTRETPNLMTPGFEDREEASPDVAGGPVTRILMGSSRTSAASTLTC
jgi:hypothetical protein